MFILEIFIPFAGGSRSTLSTHRQWTMCAGWVHLICFYHIPCLYITQQAISRPCNRKFTVVFKVLKWRIWSKTLVQRTLACDRGALSSSLCPSRLSSRRPMAPFWCLFSICSSALRGLHLTWMFNFGFRGTDESKYPLLLFHKAKPYKRLRQRGKYVTH